MRLGGTLEGIGERLLGESSARSTTRSGAGMNQRRATSGPPHAIGTVIVCSDLVAECGTVGFGDITLDLVAVLASSAAVLRWLAAPPRVLTDT